MKKFFYCLVVLLLTVTNNFAQSKSFVKTSGKNFVDTDGNVLILKGINIGNWLNPEGYMFHLENTSSFRLIDNVIKELTGTDDAVKFWQTFRDNYITKEDIHFIKSTGLNHIRLPFNFKLFVVEDYPEVYLEEGFKRLDDAIKWCREENLYVILDMHAAPGGQTGDNIDDSWGYPYIFENERAAQTAVDLWRKLAERYKDETIVIGYDLLNEPIAHFFENKEELNAKLEPLYKRMTNAIREADKNHIVFLGGAQWNTNYKVFGEPFDKNLAYTFHRYWMPPEQDQIQEHIDFRDKYNVPQYLGESGENEDEWIDAFRKLLEKNEISWCFWPYKKMDSTRGIASFIKTKEWEEIIKYAEGSRKNYDEVRKNKPSREVVNKALSDLLENIKFKNCTINGGYLKALGVQ
ncbi:MAG: glycoside hydrolase family 5 protein [Ignavibacteriales bacterium]|nr:glycoside hydrolase family 5 protein [Ignavibacteriales bacterium]